MFRIESGASFSGESLANWLITNDALHGAATNLLMSAHDHGHHNSGKNILIRLEAFSVNRVSPRPPAELWQVKMVATLEDGSTVIPRSVAFYWMRSVIAGSAPFLSVNGSSSYPADLIFNKILSSTKIPA